MVIKIKIGKIGKYSPVVCKMEDVKVYMQRNEKLNKEASIAADRIAFYVYIGIDAIN